MIIGKESYALIKVHQCLNHLKVFDYSICFSFEEAKEFFERTPNLNLIIMIDDYDQEALCDFIMSSARKNNMQSLLLVGATSLNILALIYFFHLSAEQCVISLVNTSQSIESMQNEIFYHLNRSNLNSAKCPVSQIKSPDFLFTGKIN